MHFAMYIYKSIFGKLIVKYRLDIVTFLIFPEFFKLVQVHFMIEVTISMMLQILPEQLYMQKGLREHCPGGPSDKGERISKEIFQSFVKNFFSCFTDRFVWSVIFICGSVSSQFLQHCCTLSAKLESMAAFISLC